MGEREFAHVPHWKAEGPAPDKRSRGVETACPAPVTVPWSARLSGWLGLAPPPSSLDGLRVLANSSPILVKKKKKRQGTPLHASDWKMFHSLPASTLYWLKFPATPLPSSPVQLVVPSLKSLCLAVGSILSRPPSSTLGTDRRRRSLFWNHASAVSAGHTSKFCWLRPLPLASRDPLFLLAGGPIGR